MTNQGFSPMRTAGKAGGPQRHHVLDRQRRVAAVEVAHLGGLHIGGADSQERASGVERFCIDQLRPSVCSSGLAE
jgi:hypothetical protein